MFTPVQKCEECCYFTTSTFFLKIHLKRHILQELTFDCGKNELEEFLCDKCPFKTQLLARFGQHLQETKCKTKVSTGVGDDIKQHRCIYDNVHKYLVTSAFSTIDQSNWKHFNCETANLEKYHCNECQFSTYFYRTLRGHIQSIHFYLKQNEIMQGKNAKCASSESIKWHHCTQCEYKGKSHIYLKKHIAYNHLPDEIVKIHQCTKCDYRAKTRYQLQTHVKFKHTPDNQIQWHKCDQCDYKAKQADTLKIHKINKHTPPGIIEWHKCDFCDYKAKKVGYVRTHVLAKHTPADKIQWHQCEQCSHKSKSRSYLRKHIKFVHTPHDEIQWHICEICGCKCKRRGDLKRHTVERHQMK